MPDDLVREARELYDEDREADQHNLDEALIDFKFCAGEQWARDVERQREADGRPCLTINRTPQFVNQVIGDIRLNPPAIKIRPVDQGADPKMAEVFTGLCRDIEAQSDAETVYVTAAENAVIGGLGAFRICTEYADDSAFDQEIRIKRIPSPFAVVWDAGAVELTRRDAEHCFVTERITKRAFEKRFPDAAPDSWDGVSTDVGTWIEGDFVRIAEYWKKTPITKTLCLLRDGKVVDSTSLKGQAKDEIKPLIVRERKVSSHKITSCLVSGFDVLSEAKDWAGRYIPIVPVIGREVHVDERVVRSGLIRHMRDAQRMYNLHRSSLAEAIAMAPKAKWLVTMNMIAGVEKYWQTANTNNHAFLPYKADGGNVPQRIAPEIPSSALLQEIGLAATDMEATTGIYRAALGAPSQERSGKAILAKQREGDVGSYTFADNLKKAVAHCGRILVDLIPRIYDTQRVVRTLGEDGTEDLVQINTLTPDGQKINDISVGRYDVVASTGPSYSTRREEARESMVAFMQAYPPAAPLIGDLFAKNMDWPGADEIGARLRKATMAQMPGLIEPNDEEKGAMAANPQPPPPPDPKMLQLQLDAQMAQVTALKEQAAAEAKKAEIAIKARELEIAERDQALKERAQGAAEAETGIRLKIEMARAEADREVQVAKALSDSLPGLVEALNAFAQQAATGAQVMQEAAQQQQQAIVALAQGQQAQTAALVAAITAPRQSVLQRDEAGRPAGAVSQVVN